MGLYCMKMISFDDLHMMAFGSGGPWCLGFLKIVLVTLECTIQ
jgi:hypothetical protein